MPRIKIQKLSDIIPLLEQGLTLREVGNLIGKSEMTMWRYAKRLREAGYKLPTRKGRRKLEL